MLIPGIQGRWEWMDLTVEALAQRCRVITFSLGRATSTSDTIRQIDSAMDRARIDAAVVCGVSLGGIVALRYALERQARTRGIVLASTPGPRWEPNGRQAFFARHWAAASPLFALNAALVLLPEVIRARGALGGLGFAVTQGLNVLTHPASPRRMKERYDLWLSSERDGKYAHIGAPALIVTGERGFDRVVPVDGTLEYSARIPHAHVETIERTGHIGLITRADRFAEVVANFANACNR